MKPALLILAAGMGSRYGGIKQLDAVGPNGETIMDYSVTDAISAGFGKIVFVIRKSIEEDFKSLILPKYESRIPVEYVFQEMDDLPVGCTANPERKKPYGTAHAIRSARNVIDTPFAVINADDFYGRDAFRSLSDFFRTDFPGAKPVFSMVGYQLNKTLSENGSVSRGVCATDSDGYLLEIREMTKIKRYPEGIKNMADDGTVTLLPEDTPVSMNCWGFTPLIFSFIEDLFLQFLHEENDNPVSEFIIPAVVNHLLESGAGKIKVLRSEAEWFGITYQEDRGYVVQKLKEIRR